MSGILAKAQILVFMQHDSSMAEVAPGQQWWGMQRGLQAELEAGRGVRVQGESRGVEGHACCQATNLMQH